MPRYLLVVETVGVRPQHFRWHFTRIGQPLHRAFGLMLGAPRTVDLGAIAGRQDSRFRVAVHTASQGRKRVAHLLHSECKTTAQVQ